MGTVRKHMETSSTGSTADALEAGAVRASLGNATSIPPRWTGVGVQLLKKKDDSHVVHLNFGEKKQFWNNFGSKAWSMWISGSVKPDHAEITTQNTGAEQCEMGKRYNAMFLQEQ